MILSKIKKDIKKVFLVLFLSEFLYIMFIPVYTFLFMSKNSPLINVNMDMKSRAALFGIFFAIISLASVLSNPIFGSLSDVFGRKKILLLSIISLIFVSIASIVSIFLKNLFLFMISYTIFQFLFSFKSVSLASIVDLSEEKTKNKNIYLFQFFIH